jgi:acetyltransferase-like isoleucine patch superfamily enzyme
VQSGTAFRNGLARVLGRLLNHYRVFGPAGRVSIARTAVLNDAILNTVSGRITIGEHAFFGHSVRVLTGTHDVTARMEARGKAIPPSGRDVTIGEGVWVSSGALLLGPLTVGPHAVVAAGAVVVDDVPAFGLVAGVPARLVRTVGRPADDPRG